MLPAAFKDYLTSEKRYSPLTVKAYLRDLDQFTDYYNTAYGSLGWEVVQAFHVRGFIVFLHESGDSPRSIRRKLSSLNSFYHYLRIRHGLGNNPCQNIVKPKAGKKLPSFIAMEEVGRLEQNRGNKFADYRDALTLSLLYCTGVRVSELCSILDSDIDLQKGYVKVTGKRSKQRIIPLLPGLITLISEYQELRDKELNEKAPGHLLLTDTGKPVYPRFIQRLTAREISVAGISSKGNPHIFRHTFATHLLNNGADINAVKELLGHSSLAATQIYTHNTIDKLRKIHEQAHPRAKKQK